jgi:hypothetical protein
VRTFGLPGMLVQPGTSVKAVAALLELARKNPGNIEGGPTR